MCLANATKSKAGMIVFKLDTQSFCLTLKNTAGHSVPLRMPRNRCCATSCLVLRLKPPPSFFTLFLPPVLYEGTLKKNPTAPFFLQSWQIVWETQEHGLCFFFCCCQHQTEQEQKVLLWLNVKGGNAGAHVNRWTVLCNRWSLYSLYCVCALPPPPPYMPGKLPVRCKKIY